MLFKCKHCNSSTVRVQKAEGSPHTGLYCADCGKWITWLGKKQIGDRELSRQINDSLRIIDARESSPQRNYTESRSGSDILNRSTDPMPFDGGVPINTKLSTHAAITVKSNQEKLMACIAGSANSDIDLTIFNVVISDRGIIMQNRNTLAVCVLVSFDK